MKNVVVIDVDIFFVQLIKAIVMWYDENYMNKDNRKFLHLATLMDQYVPARFKETDNLNKERDEFLAEIQEQVENDVSNIINW